MKRIGTIKKGWIKWSIIILAATIFSGCGGNYGRLRYSPEITNLFMQNQMLSGYNYYYTGRHAIPYAIVGIRSDYVLDLKFWSPIEKGTHQIDGLIDRLYGSDFDVSRGAEIIDPQGSPIGIWYSVYTMTRVQFGPDKQVNVFSPYSPSRHSRVIY